MRERPVPQWQKEEWACIAERRRAAYATPASSEESPQPKEPRQPDNLVGLTLSGGGIRSALYNDGFLQGLSHRGLLRYVDYISSVSGGGYIAGHLSAQQAPSSDGSGSFHDREKSRNLGRDPDTGKVATNRLAGVGGYLSRPFEFLPAYLWSFVFSLTFYIGLVGVVATLAALFWRTFDGHMFREIYISSLGLYQFGGELLIAFIPAILLALLTLLFEAVISGYRFFVGLHESRPRHFHRRGRAILMVATGTAALVSLAIFLGNGKSHVPGGKDGEVHLNHYVQYFAIMAGIIQVLVFLGRDRLFRSERGEAKQWQRYLQQGVTTVVILFLVFSMVHWMGRENISDYTSDRDPHLVTGDVIDWNQLTRLISAYETDSGVYPLSVVPEYESLHYRTGADLLPAGNWGRSLAVGRLGLGFDHVHPQDLADPMPSLLAAEASHATASAALQDDSEGPSTGPTPTQVATHLNQSWSLPERIYGAGIGYALSLRDGPMEVLPAGDSSANGSLDTSVYRSIHNEIAKRRKAMHVQSDYLTNVNHYLEDPRFIAFLLSGFPSDEEKSFSGYLEFSKAISEHLDALKISISDEQRKHLLAACRELALSHPHFWQRPAFSITQSHDAVERRTDSLIAVQAATLAARATAASPANVGVIPMNDMPWPPPPLPHEVRSTVARANRILLESFWPAMVQRRDIPSTWVVPIHDQQTRRRWLTFWMAVLLVGLLGGLGPYRVATVFQFYRRQLSSNFLVNTEHPKVHAGEYELNDLRPTADGLPYPLILATTLEPALRNGSYFVNARPFVFSPLYSGSFEEGETPIRSAQVSFSLKPGSAGVTLGDAVTLSGSAVTPLMSENRWLSVILDFFNTGIGQRVRRVDRCGPVAHNDSKVSTLVSIVIGVVVLLAGWYLLDMRWSLVLALGLTWLMCFCFVNRIGSPGLLRSLAFAQEVDHHEPPDYNQRRSFYVADGGYCDYLGVTELLRRRCELIVVSDAGANIGENSLGTLARMCENASQDMGIRFLDLDHEAPIDFGRLEMDEQRFVHQPYLCMRVRYPEATRQEGLLVYCQMSITDTDPIEIKNIRNLFPSFPDEPTVNQFYTEKQVSAYRALGYHIASRVCNEVQHWYPRQTSVEESPATVQTDEQTLSQDQPTDAQTLKSTWFRRCLKSGLSRRELAAEATQETSGQPLFDVLLERLKTAYRLACHEEQSYRADDIFSEAIWPSATYAFPKFRDAVDRLANSRARHGNVAEFWLRQYEYSADVRSAYRTAVISDINAMDIGSESLCGVLWTTIRDICGDKVEPTSLLAAHLLNIGTACQEIHRGRPHAAFQVGGRDKLLQLCSGIATVIFDCIESETKEHRYELLLTDIDRIVAELIELERSVFQGSEHVATISFAQCAVTMWGRIARDVSTEGQEQDVFVGLKLAFLASNSPDNTASSSSASVKSAELRVAEVRHQLDVGLRRMRLQVLRLALGKSWYLGYYTTDEIKERLDLHGVDSADTGKPTTSKKVKKRNPVRKPEP